MINLLPYEMKRQIRAARTNEILVRYTIFLGLAIVFLAAACITSYFILNNSKTSAKNAIAVVKSKNSSYSSVTNQASQLVLNLTTAKNILDQQISYSTIITEFATVLPTGVILESPLTFTNSTIGTSMTLKFHSRLSSDEPTLKANFQKSSLFSNYTLQSLTTPGDPTGYPVLIQISITINKVAVK